MHTNSQREPPLIKHDDAREGSAMLVMDEANKLASLGQYKSGKSDHRERFMELSNGELVKTDRKGASQKMLVAQKKPSADSSPMSASPTTTEENDGEEETFTSALVTEEVYAKLSSILFTHPFRLGQWTGAEQEADGTDGWTVRLIAVERVASKGCDELIELSESTDVQVLMYHLLCAAHVLCEEQPTPEKGLPWKMLEYDDECVVE